MGPDRGRKKMMGKCTCVCVYYVFAFVCLYVCVCHDERHKIAVGCCEVMSPDRWNAGPKRETRAGVFYESLVR